MDTLSWKYGPVWPSMALNPTFIKCLVKLICHHVWFVCSMADRLITTWRDMDQMSADVTQENLTLKRQLMWIVDGLNHVDSWFDHEFMAKTWSSYDFTPKTAGGNGWRRPLRRQRDTWRRRRCSVWGYPHWDKGPVTSYNSAEMVVSIEIGVPPVIIQFQWDFPF